MNFRNTLTIGMITFVLFSCAETTDENGTIVSSESDQETEESRAKSEAKKVISFDDNSSFTISTNTEVEVTGTKDIDIFLNNDQFDSPVLLTQDLNYTKVDPKKYKDVPNESVFVFSTWFGGGGLLYYGVVKNGVLQVYRKYGDEMMTQESAYEFYREFDPNVQTVKPTYYIHYSPDTKKGNDLMIAFTPFGKGLFAKYEGQSRQIELKFTKDQSEGKNIIQYFDEIVKGEVKGTYKMTHSGNYDYVEYTNKKSGKKYLFTINHDVTIVGDTYRTTPSF